MSVSHLTTSHHPRYADAFGPRAISVVRTSSVCTNDDNQAGRREAIAAGPSTPVSAVESESGRLVVLGPSRMAPRLLTGCSNV